MILDFVAREGNNESGAHTFDGVPELLNSDAQVIKDHATSTHSTAIIVANTTEQAGWILHRIASKNSHAPQIKAIVLMSQTGPDTWLPEQWLEKDEKLIKIPVFLGRRLRLPKGYPFVSRRDIIPKVHCKKTARFIPHVPSLWGTSEIIESEGNFFLAPQYSSLITPHRLKIKPNIDVTNIHTDVDIRRLVLGHLGMPTSISISSEGNITINPK